MISKIKTLYSKLTDFIDNLGSLDMQIFWITLIVADIACFGSALFTFAKGLGLLAAIFSFICFAFLFSITIYALIRKPKDISVQYLFLCAVLSLIMMPILYFTCGGIHCGMMMYFLTCIYLISMCKKGRMRSILFVASLTVLTSCFIIDWLIPGATVDVTKNRTDFSSTYLDDTVSFALNALVIYILASKTINAYSNERQKNSALLEKVEYFSKFDDLTGLYNRRVFFTYLEELITENRDGYYIAMYDIDNFKSVNDSYGHSFGDTVLSAVAHVLSDHVNPEEGESAARYGGEEFICIIHAASKKSAFERADNIRKKVSVLSFSEEPQFSVAVSGGIAPCNCEVRSSLIIKKADEMLYYSKHHGKNIVSTSWNTDN